MGQQRKMLSAREFVIEGDEDAAAIKNCVGRNQPLRLIRHDDGGAVARSKARVLQGARQRERRLLKIGVSEPGAFGVAVRFNQADFVGPAVQSVPQSFAQALIFR